MRRKAIEWLLDHVHNKWIRWVIILVSWALFWVGFEFKIVYPQGFWVGGWDYWIVPMPPPSMVCGDYWWSGLRRIEDD